MQTHHAKHQRKLKLHSQQWSKQCSQRGAFLPPLPSKSHLRWPQAQTPSETVITTLQSHWALSSLSSQAGCSHQFFYADQFCQVLNRSFFSPTSLYPAVLTVFYLCEKLLYCLGIQGAVAAPVKVDAPEQHCPAGSNNLPGEGSPA